MGADRPDIKSIFGKAMALSSTGERAAYLQQICDGDTELRAEVESLLEAHGDAGSFLDEREPCPGATVDDPIRERPGMVIGAYKLMEQIGEGGMGLVFVAEQQQPVRRRVALKLIKPGMDTREVIARFEAERQALALMDHPNIAKVLDAGATDSGRPFFVMELVKGVPITQFCDNNRLVPRERLELFVSVCQAVQHAHQKGIIHRDVKPSNVLVALHDTTPVVKVIDFGVAKAVGRHLTEKTVYTGWAQMVGTPLYMSPEQAGQSGLDIDTRTDIYALGVLLYELLTGTTPFEGSRLRQANYDEIRRIIREEEPPRPSTRISTLGQAAATVSANRQSDPKKLGQLMRGELDWIVMKALEKDRTRRYETASAFAADVQHYLHDEPVQACPPSAWYRFRKFVRRNKRAAVMAGFLSALLIVAVAVLAMSYFQVQEALHDKTEALDREKETGYLQRIALAERELATGNVGRAEELLDECPEHLRGWEWHFLKRQRYDGEPTPLPHSATVTRVALSPDGRQLASACYDGTFQIWDAHTRRKLHTLEQQMARGRAVLVRGMAYSPDSRYLALARHDGSVRVWDALREQPLHILEGHKGPAWQVAFSPDSRTLASAGSDKSVRLWDLTSGTAIRVFSEHPAAVKGVAFRPDGRSVLAACEDGTVKVWDRDTGRQTFSFRSELRYPFYAWFSPDARRLAWSSMDGVINVWDTTTGRLEITKRTNSWQLRSVAFHPDGKRMAVAAFDGTVRLLDAATGREMLTIFAHPSVVSHAVFSHDGNKIVSGGYDHTVRIWDATPLGDDSQADRCVTLSGHKALVSAVAFSPDSRWLASSSWDSTVKVWEVSRVEPARRAEPEPEGPLGSGHLPALALRYTLRGHSGNVSGVAFSPDKRTLASGSWDKTVKLWNLQAPAGDSLSELRTISCTERVAAVAFSPDGRLLAIGQTDGIRLYDPASGERVAPFKRTPAPVPALAFSPDSRHLVSAGASYPALMFWHVAGEETTFEIRHYSNPNVAVSPDGRLIAAPSRLQAAASPTVKIWEVLDWDAKTSKTPYEELHTLSGHAARVWKVAFSPDGRYLASGSWDSTIKVWDLKALAKNPKAEPVTLRGHASFIYGLAFSPDGRYLASGSGYARHGEVKVWDATLWEPKANGGER
ncbi:MAG TPA: protein kinase [Gemmataceae bacterium]|jgi:WD40 repeat protein/serine/threonine protein kinase